MQRIFLVGCPRSGTTLVQSLLAAAPGRVTFTESHFFDKCFGSPVNPIRRGRLRRDVAAATIARFCGENDVQEAVLPADAWRSAETVAAAFLDLLDRHAGAQGADGWIEKTPDHLWRIPLIAAAAPGAQFVHVLRQPAGTVASLCSASLAWGKPRGWLAFAAKWACSVSASARYAGTPGHVHVFYEDVVGDTRKEARRLFDALDLAWDEGVLQRYREAARMAVAPHESWKRNNARDIGPQSDVGSARGQVPSLLLGRLDSLYRRVKSDVESQRRG